MCSKFAAGLVLALGAATVAQAGPVGSGLSLTEEVARKAAAERLETVRLAPPSRDCVPAVVAALRRHEAVKGMMVEASDLSITVRTNVATAKGGDLQALVAKACAPATAAAAS